MTHDLTQRYVAERVTLAAALTRSGWFASELGVTRRTVVRYRARIRAGAR